MVIAGDGFQNVEAGVDEWGAGLLADGDCVLPCPNYHVKVCTIFCLLRQEWTVVQVESILS